MEDYINYNSFDPNVMMKRAEELGTEWAEADAAHGILEDTKKTLLAKITFKMSSTLSAEPIIVAQPLYICWPNGSNL